MKRGVPEHMLFDDAISPISDLVQLVSVLFHQPTLFMHSNFRSLFRTKHKPTSSRRQLCKRETVVKQRRHCTYAKQRVVYRNCTNMDPSGPHVRACSKCDSMGFEVADDSYIEICWLIDIRCP